MVLDGARNSASKGLTAVHLAVQQGCDSLVNDLLRLPGLAPDARDADGLTALHWAASKGRCLPCSCHASCARSRAELVLQPSMAPVMCLMERAAMHAAGGCNCSSWH